MQNLEWFLTSIPDELTAELIASYKNIITNFSEQRWEPSELNGGKFCEVVFCIIQGALLNTFPTCATKPDNMAQSCRALEKIPSSTDRVGDRSLRILIPRLLPVLYEIRNNRGVGDVGGEVDPNHEDATAVVAMATWIIAELVRIFHEVTIEKAQRMVDTLVERRHPLVWSVDNYKRVLNPKLSYANQVLALLYSETDWTNADDLYEWVEYSDKSLFKKNILSKLHEARKVEYVATKNLVRITPVGAMEVESTLGELRDKGFAKC